MRRGLSLPLAIVAIALLCAACASTSRRGSHTVVPGTKVSLILPAGFSIAERFRGVEGPDGLSITITELPDPEQVVLASMTESRLEQRGMRLQSTAQLDVEGVSRQLLEVTQESSDGSSLRRSILVIGDLTSTAVLVASMPATSERSGQDRLAACLLSARRDPDRIVSAFEGLGFTIEATESLAIHNRVLDTISLRRPGATPSAAEPHFIAGRSAMPELLDLSAFSNHRLAETPELFRISVVSTRFVEIDGMPAFEVIARALDRRTETPLVVVQTIVIDGNRYYLLQGRVGSGDADRFVPQFQQIAAGFRLSR